MELIQAMKEPQSVYDRAKKRVEDLKSFYNHLKIFLIANILLIVAKLSINEWMQQTVENEELLRWLDVNIYVTPLIWGLVILGHGIYAYRHKFRFLKKWEDQKIQEFLDEED